MDLKERVNELEKKLKKRFRGKRFQQTEGQILAEKECIFLLNEIKQYGTEFFPEHYILDKVEELEKRLQRL